MKMELEKRLNEVRKIAKEISYVLLKRNEVSYTPEDITFSIYDIKNKDLGEFDYIKVSVEYKPEKSIFDYKREIERKIFKKDYEVYRASDLEKEVIRYINENKISNAWVCKGELHVEMEDIKLDPIDLKYYTEFNIEVDEDGELELTIKYKYDNNIYIVNNGDELYVEEYDEDGNECCIYCHNELFEECICNSDEEAECKEFNIYEQEVKELNEIIKEKDELIDKLEKEKKEILDVVEKVYKSMARRLGVRV